MSIKLKSLHLPFQTGELVVADSTAGDANYSPVTLAITELYLQEASGKTLDDGIILEDVFKCWIPAVKVENNTVIKKNQKLVIAKVTYQVTVVANRNYGLFEPHWELTLEKPNVKSGN